MFLSESSPSSLPNLDDIRREKERRGLTLLNFEEPPAHFHEGQVAAWLSTCMEVVVCAGAQGGKTEFLVYWLLREIQRCGEWIKKTNAGKFLVVGPTMTLMESQLFQTFERVFVEEFNLGTLVKGNRPRFTFSAEGLKRMFGWAGPTVTVHFAYASDSNNLESMTALACIWDEAGQQDNKLASFFACNRRLKIGRSQGMGRRAWGSTPYEWNWFKTKVHDPAMNNVRGYELFRFESWMNPVVDREEIEKDKDEMPLWQWEMMYMGIFRKPAGAIFDSFEPLYRDFDGVPMPPRILKVDEDTKIEMFGKNVCKRFTIPVGWRFFSGHDFGQVNTAAVFAAQNPETGIVYIYAAYHREDEDAASHAKNFLALAGLKKPPIAWGGSNGETGWRNDFRDVGYPINEPAVSGPGSIKLRNERTWSLFKRGLLVVFSDLTLLVDDIESYSYELDDEGNAIEDKIEKKATWHRIDAMTYMGASLYVGLGEPLPSEPISRIPKNKEVKPLHHKPSQEERMRVAYSRR